MYSRTSMQYTLVIDSGSINGLLARNTCNLFLCNDRSSTVTLSKLSWMKWTSQADSCNHLVIFSAGIFPVMDSMPRIMTASSSSTLDSCISVTRISSSSISALRLAFLLLAVSRCISNFLFISSISLLAIAIRCAMVILRIA